MSLGPTPKESNKVSGFNRLSYQAKKITQEYFKKPLYYLFYGQLFLTILGLFCGLKFGFEFYSILGVLSGVQIYNHFYGK